MKKIKYILFVFVMLMLLNSEVKAMAFSCRYGDIVLKYHVDGGFGFVDYRDNGYDGIIEFEIKNETECPIDPIIAYDGEFFHILNGSIYKENETNFMCKIGDYLVEYTEFGEFYELYKIPEYKVVRRDDIFSFVSPKDILECPKNYKVVKDGSKYIIMGDGTQQNFDPNDVKNCGNDYKKIDNIPGLIPRTTSIIYTIIQIAIPVVLVLLGSIDLVKGIIAQKEEDIKKGQKTFVKRLIAGCIIFFVFTLVKLFISVVSDDWLDRDGIIDCMECFIENKCD